MCELEFIPVLIGSDANVYGMARSFHEEYNICSVAISKTNLSATSNSKIIKFFLEGDLENPEKFLNILDVVKNEYINKKLLLIPCGDGYVKLVVNLQEKLKDNFYFNCLSSNLMEQLTLKDSFYEICDKYGFDYPKTTIITYENHKSTNIFIDFPVIIKACNSVSYWQCSFTGKRKVFIAQDEKEYFLIINAIYSSSYKDDLTIQEFIPGDDSFMRVLNCYVSKNKEVQLMALGHALLEEHTPQGIGSYVAIINTFDKALLEKFKFFLEDIGYQGFANFDMKLDIRDNKYKLFETNIRQGRSSFFVTASGFNLAKFIVDDVIYNKETPLTIAKNEHLFLQVPKGILFKYIKDKDVIEKIKILIKTKKVTNSLFYAKDFNLKRYIMLKLVMLNHYRKYKKFYGKKGFMNE